MISLICHSNNGQQDYSWTYWLRKVDDSILAECYWFDKLS